MDAWEKFKKSVEKNSLVKAGDKIILAVSGGPDSVCLMHLFWRLKKTLPIELLIVYLNHGLRKESVREEKLIAGYGRKFDISVVIRKIPVSEFADIKKISVETAGRNLRYETLTKLAKENRCTKIATGHNGNDNAETMIMWLLRGTGTDGLAGIPVRRFVGADLSARLRAGRHACAKSNQIEIIRPILSITRNEIIEYLNRQKLSYCIDKSNYSLDYARNRIRHQIIPVLQKYNPRIGEHLYNLSNIVREENSFINGIAAKAMKRCLKAGKNKISLDLRDFFEYNKPIQLRILKKILPEKRSAANIERLYDWIFSPFGKEMTFSNSWNLARNKNKLVFNKREK